MKYRELENTLKNKGVKLVAVSKTKPPQAVSALYEKGQRVFGENRAQELLEKQELLPEDIEWHMIGHLQRNKVKALLPDVSMIQSVDSPRLYRQIVKDAEGLEKKIQILLQVKIAEEPSKYGFQTQALKEFLRSEPWQSNSNIRICGLMGMASFVEDSVQVRREFRSLKTLFDELKADVFSQYGDFSTLSMGMSGDYDLAIEEGSNMVRIGSLLFGERD